MAKAATAESETNEPIPRNLVTIAQAKCKGCELCVVSCPLGCLLLARDHFNPKGYHPAEFRYKGTKGACTGCGTCFIVCPDGAITTVKTLKQEGKQ